MWARVISYLAFAAAFGVLAGLWSAWFALPAAVLLLGAAVVYLAGYEGRHRKPTSRGE